MQSLPEACCQQPLAATSPIRAVWSPNPLPAPSSTPPCRCFRAPRRPPHAPACRPTSDRWPTAPAAPPAAARRFAEVGAKHSAGQPAPGTAASHPNASPHSGHGRITPGCFALGRSRAGSALALQHLHGISPHLQRSVPPNPSPPPRTHGAACAPPSGWAPLTAAAACLAPARRGQSPPRGFAFFQPEASHAQPRAVRRAPQAPPRPSDPELAI